MAKKSVKVDEDLIRGYMAGREPDNVSKNETSVQEILNEAITTRTNLLKRWCKKSPSLAKERKRATIDRSI